MFISVSALGRYTSGFIASWGVEVYKTLKSSNTNANYIFRVWVKAADWEGPADVALASWALTVITAATAKEEARIHWTFESTVCERLVKAFLKMLYSCQTSNHQKSLGPHESSLQA